MCAQLNAWIDPVSLDKLQIHHEPEVVTEDKWKIYWKDNAENKVQSRQK